MCHAYRQHSGPSYPVIFNDDVTPHLQKLVARCIGGVDSVDPILCLLLFDLGVVAI